MKNKKKSFIVTSYGLISVKDIIEDRVGNIIKRDPAVQRFIKEYAESCAKVMLPDLRKSPLMERMFKDDLLYGKSSINIRIDDNRWTFTIPAKMKKQEKLESKKYHLFLDDIRIPSAVGNYIYPIEHRAQYRLEDWIIVRNYKEFVDYVKENGIPSKVSFDHDLAEIHYDPSTWTQDFIYDEETGYDCVMWLCNYCAENNLDFPEYYLHTMNPIGRDNMKIYIEGFKNSQICK